MAFITDSAFDAALNYIRTNATALHICSAQPTDYANVSSVSLGIKTSPVIASPANRTGGGRQITVSAITDGEVTAGGDASNYAIVSGSELLASGDLSTTRAVTSGSVFTLTEFEIGVPDAV